MCELGINMLSLDGTVVDFCHVALSRMGITGNTAKSRQRNFFPSSYPGSLSAVA